MKPLAWGTGIVVAGVLVFGAATADKRTDAEKFQDAEYAQKGKYTHVPLHTGADGIERRMDEYLHPDGSRGYSITETRTTRDGVKETRTISHDSEVQATDWTPIPVWTSSTSTP